MLARCVYVMRLVLGDMLTNDHACDKSLTERAALTPDLNECTAPGQLLGQILAQMSRGHHHAATHASHAHLLEPLSIATMQHLSAAQKTKHLNLLKLAKTPARPVASLRTDTTRDLKESIQSLERRITFLKLQERTGRVDALPRPAQPESLGKELSLAHGLKLKSKGVGVGGGRRVREASQRLDLVQGMAYRDLDEKMESFDHLLVSCC